MSLSYEQRLEQEELLRKAHFIYEQSPKDQFLVMQQVSCTFEESYNALVKHNGDIVESIMELQF